MPVFLLGNILKTFLIFQSSADILHDPPAKPPFLLTVNKDTVLRVWEYDLCCNYKCNSKKSKKKGGGGEEANVLKNKVHPLINVVYYTLIFLVSYDIQSQSKDLCHCILDLIQLSNSFKYTKY
jgi:hypothetical protein